MAKFSIEIDLPGLKEDQVVNLNEMSDTQKHTLVRVLAGACGSLQESSPKEKGFGERINRWIYAMFVAT